MDINSFQRKIAGKMAEMRRYLEGSEVRELMGGIAINHFQAAFHREGQEDSSGKVQPWKEVERRKPTSPWYGHSGQTGKFSNGRTKAKILTGETGHLYNSFTYVPSSTGIKVRNLAPYARVHQYGLPAKIYGKKPFTMPKRPFMATSPGLVKEIKKEITVELTKILKR